MSKNNISRQEARTIARKLTPMLIEQLAERIQETDEKVLEELDIAEKQYQEAANRRRTALYDLFAAVRLR